MRHIVQQKPLTVAGNLSEPTQGDIQSEPIFRRATADFVRKNGGNIARLFLERLETIDLINDRSRFLCQRCLYVQGAYPSPPNWHVDYMPGTPVIFREHILNPTRGAIASLCSQEKVSTTTFLLPGSVVLEEPEHNELIAKGNEYLEATAGRLNWCTTQIEDLIAKERIRAESIAPNQIHLYDSSNIHRPPQFAQSGGYRVILRANTPPADFPYEIPIRNELLEHPDFFFTLTGDQWQKCIVGRGNT